MSDTPKFQIGDRVICTALASMKYDESDMRFLHREPGKPFEAVVTGQKRKFLGVYQPSSPGYSLEYDLPPYLQVTGSVLLWCVRKSMSGAEILVSEEDMQAMNDS